MYEHFLALGSLSPLLSGLTAPEVEVSLKQNHWIKFKAKNFCSRFSLGAT